MTAYEFVRDKCKVELYVAQDRLSRNSFNVAYRIMFDYSDLHIFTDTFNCMINGEVGILENTTVYDNKIIIDVLKFLKFSSDPIRFLELDWRYKFLDKAFKAGVHRTVRRIKKVSK